MRRIAYFVLACLPTVAGETHAAPETRDAPPAEARIIPYAGVLPACADPFVLAQISRDFSDRESAYWASDLSIAAWVHVREVGYRNNGEAYIPRRYCSALAEFNDGRRRRVGYDLGEDLGFSGVGWGVEWCVVGLDRDLSFAPNCKMTRP